MDVVVIVCSRNTNVTMVWAWMLWWPSALVTRTLVWLQHGCCGDRALYENELDYGCGCSDDRIPSEHERYDGCGMDALVTVWSGNTNLLDGLGMDALVTVCML